MTRVPAEGGGEREEIERLAEDAWASFAGMLPDGRAALVASKRSSSFDYGEVRLYSLETGQTTVLLERGYEARYLAPGHLLFARSGSLYAVPFDAQTLQVDGAVEPVQVISNVNMESLFGQGQFAVSVSGSLVFLPGGEQALGKIAAVSRDGEVEFLGMPEAVYGFFDLSPDGNRFAIQVDGLTDTILIWDRLADTDGRTLAGSSSYQMPIWDRAGENVTYNAVEADGSWQILSQRAAGGGSVQTLLAGDSFPAPQPSSWSSSGQVLALDEWGDDPRIGFLDTSAEAEPIWAASPGFNQTMPTFSRDGTAVGYMTNESGRYEIEVRSYADAEDWRPVSNGAGGEAVFCRACDDIFYHLGNTWYAARVTTTPELQIGPPRLVWQTDFIDTPGRSYDVSPDGQTLYVVKRTRP